MRWPAATLVTLPQDSAQAWLALPWDLLQCTPSAQERWGLRRIGVQALANGRCVVVAESSPAFAAAHLDVYGLRSSAAQVLGAKPEPAAEAQVLDALSEALIDLTGLPLTGAQTQLMRWGAAFPTRPDRTRAIGCAQ